MAKDWRSGTLLGAGYALIVGDKAVMVSVNRTLLVNSVRVAAEKAGLDPDSTEKHIKQVCIILPPWEDAQPSPEDR